MWNKYITENWKVTRIKILKICLHLLPLNAIIPEYRYEGPHSKLLWDNGISLLSV
jgi:hypothetical protein